MVFVCLFWCFLGISAATLWVAKTEEFHANSASLSGTFGTAAPDSAMPCLGRCLNLVLDFADQNLKSV